MRTILKFTGCVLAALGSGGGLALLVLGLFQISHFDRIYPGPDLLHSVDLIFIIAKLERVLE